MKRKQWLSMALACCMAAGSHTAVFAQENEETVELTALISKHSLTKDVNEMEWLTELEAQNGVAVADYGRLGSEEERYVCWRRYPRYPF